MPTVSLPALYWFSTADAEVKALKSTWASRCSPGPLYFVFGVSEYEPVVGSNDFSWYGPFTIFHSGFVAKVDWSADCEVRYA